MAISLNQGHKITHLAKVSIGKSFIRNNIKPHKNVVEIVIFGLLCNRFIKNPPFLIVLSLIALRDETTREISPR